MSKTSTIRVYLVREQVGAQGVLRVTPRRDGEPAPAGGHLMTELPNEMIYRMLQKQLGEMAEARGILYRPTRQLE